MSAALRGVAVPQAPSGRVQGGVPQVEESVHGFGNGLVGVLSRPAGDVQLRAAVILLNAGLVHRMGPFRLYVQLARHLAARGVVVFRFDQSGWGDSSLSQSVSEGFRREEVVAAMDLVSRLTGTREFVLGGICSGADSAFNVAPHDERVTGLLLLDGVAYRTRGYRLRHQLPRLFRPAALWRYARRRLRAGNVDAAVPHVDDFRELPPQDEARTRLQLLEARGVETLMLFTGGVDYYYNHRHQAEECFGRVMRSPRILTDYWAECDHTFYVRAHRERLFRAVGEWLAGRFRSGA